MMDEREQKEGKTPRGGTASRHCSISNESPHLNVWFLDGGCWGGTKKWVLLDQA